MEEGNSRFMPSQHESTAVNTDGGMVVLDAFGDHMASKTLMMTAVSIDLGIQPGHPSMLFSTEDITPRFCERVVSQHGGPTTSSNAWMPCNSDSDDY